MRIALVRRWISIINIVCIIGWTLDDDGGDYIYYLKSPANGPGGGGHGRFVVVGGFLATYLLEWFYGLRNAKLCVLHNTQSGPPSRTTSRHQKTQVFPPFATNGNTARVK
jgi:hypothetical protein